MKGKGNRARRSATKIVTVKRADGSVETIGSHSGRESGEQNQPESKMKAREAEVVKRKSRIIEKGKKSVKIKMSRH